MTNLSCTDPYQLHQMGAGTLVKHFVERIERSSEPAFIPTIDRAGQAATLATPIGQFLPYLERMYNRAMSMDVDSGSEKLWTFREACRGIGVDSGLGGTVFLDESESRYLIPEEMMNLLVKRIRLRSQG